MVVELKPDCLETKVLRIGYAANGDERHVGLDYGSRATGRWFDSCLQDRPARIDRSHLGGKLEADALFFQDALQLPRNLRVNARQDAIQKLHHRDLGAETPRHRA